MKRLLLLMIICGCIGAAQSHLSFESGNGRCSDGPAEFTSERIGSEVRFSGAISTSNPCYDLSASHSVSGNTIQIDISAEYKGGMCIMCTGAVPFEGSVTGLEDKEYLLVIAENGRALYEETV